MDKELAVIAIKELEIILREDNLTHKERSDILRLIARYKRIARIKFSRGLDALTKDRN